MVPPDFLHIRKLPEMNIYASDPNLFTGEDGKENPKSRCAFLFLKLVGIVQTKKVIQKNVFTYICSLEYF